MKFSEWVSKQDDLQKAGEGYENLPDGSKSIIDYAVQRYQDYTNQKLQTQNRVMLEALRDLLWYSEGDLPDREYDRIIHNAKEAIKTATT